MTQDILRIPLPVAEELKIRRSRFGDGRGKRLCVVTGIHGDELEGQFVCFLVAKRLKEHPEQLHGTVDIYPAMNPLGIDSITRGIPNFDLDMNRTFPGSENGAFTEYAAGKIIDDIKGADLVLDIHSSNIFLTEMPQIRINELNKEALLPIAKKANVDFIWVHCASTVLEATFAYSLNSAGTNCLVVEMGVGMRLTDKYGEQMTDGIFNLMREMGMWDGDVAPVREPVISDAPDDVEYLNAPTSGVFMKTLSQGAHVHKGESIGFIFDPFTGEVLRHVTAPRSGLLFTVREYPIVDEGSLMGRILVRKYD